MFPLLKFGTIQIPTFYIVISLSLTFLILHFSKKIESTDISHEAKKQGFDLLIIVLLSGFIGGRLFHVIYEDPIYYKSYPLEIFKFWNGGFVYYGGFIFSLITTTLYCHTKNISFFKWADFFTPYLSMGYILGRLGCLLEGCCYGKYCDLPWNVHQRHPTQIYMILLEIFLFIFVMSFSKNAILRKHNGLLFLIWLCFHCINRFIIEFYRDDHRGFFIFNLSISQVISALFVTISIFMITSLKRSKLG